MKTFRVNTSRWSALGAGLAGILFISSSLVPAPAQQAGQPNGAVGEQPVITEHLDQDAINAGRIGSKELFEAGEKLFTARFNVLDGQGRPGATGNNNPPTPRLPLPAPLRFSAP